MGCRVLQGEDAFTWGSAKDPKGFHQDIITLKARKKEDPFTDWVAARAASILLRCFGRWKMKSRTHGEAVIYDSSVHRATLWMTSIFASLLPIASILVLTNLQTLKAKLGTIAAFNVLISVCLTIFTDAKRIDIFAVTAALVTFDSLNIPSLTFADSQQFKSSLLGRTERRVDVGLEGSGRLATCETANRWTRVKR